MYLYFHLGKWKRGEKGYVTAQLAAMNLPECVYSSFIVEGRQEMVQACCVCETQEVERERGEAKKDLYVTAAMEVRAPSHI